MITFFPTLATRVKRGPKVDLGAALYHIRATIHHPLAQKDVSLPPHFWVLYKVSSNPETILVSTASDDKGMCLIKGDVDKLDDGDELALAFFPHPDAVLKKYARDGEAWVAFAAPDTVTWVTSPPSLSGVLHRDNAVRLSQWTTVWKSDTGGGFEDAPPKAKKTFEKTGRIKVSDVEPYGTPAKPWKIALDHGFIRARVQYLFINRRTGVEEVVPPGLVVQAKGEKDKLLGAASALPAGGTASTPAGTVYLSIEAVDPTAWAKIHFLFKAPKDAHIDLRAGAESSAERLSTSSIPDDPTARTTVPALWYSDGMEARLATFPGLPPGDRKAWTDIRTTLSKSLIAAEAVVIFHLDDLVLVDHGKKPIDVAADTRTALFDHLLTLRDTDPNEPVHSKLKLQGPMLRAPDVFPIAPAAPAAPTRIFDLMTRLIYVKGTLHDVRDERVGGTPGQDKWIGLRAAVAEDHLFADYLQGNPIIKKGAYELHLIDVPGVTDPVSGQPLQHALLFIGMIIKQDGVSAADVKNLITMLARAAARWSPGHPGTRGVPGVNTKDYILLSLASGTQPVLRLRAYFGIDAKEHRSLKIDYAHAAKGRANAPEGAFLGVLELRAPRVNYYDSSVNYDVARVADTGAADSDGAHESWSTLAHELGHVLGLPDEYYEPFNPGAIDEALKDQFADPLIPMAKQVARLGTACRPYYNDRHSMMNANELTRLRQFWHHARALGEDAAFKSSKVTKGPYVPAHRNFGGGMMTFVTADTNKHSPYMLVAEKQVAGTRAIATLFSVGEDEGTVEAMYPPPTGTPPPRASDQRFDAIVVVRCFYRFDFDDSVSTGTRWAVMRLFAEGFYDTAYRPVFRFQIEPAPGQSPTFKRIAIAVHPHVSYESGENKGFLFRVAPGSLPNAKLPYFEDPIPSTLRLGVADFRYNALIRMSLGFPAWKSPRSSHIIDNDPLTSVVFALVAGAVEDMLSLGHSTYVVTPIT